jgi:hypothetical protein
VLEGRLVGQAPRNLVSSISDQQTCPQLNVIPTVGFSDPIFSYFSALQFNFDGIRMLKEGYEKVVRIFLEYIRTVLICVELLTVLLSDTTRFIQNRQFS